MQQARSCGHPDSSGQLHQLVATTPDPNLGNYAACRATTQMLTKSFSSFWRMLGAKQRHEGLEAEAS